MPFIGCVCIKINWPELGDGIRAILLESNHGVIEIGIRAYRGSVFNLPVTAPAEYENCPPLNSCNPYFAYCRRDLNSLTYIPRKTWNSYNCLTLRYLIGLDRRLPRQISYIYNRCCSLRHVYRPPNIGLWQFQISLRGVTVGDTIRYLKGQKVRSSIPTPPGLVVSCVEVKYR